MLPTGTVTFLFTDIEGSTQKWDKHPGEMQMMLSRHDEILEYSISQFGGTVVKKRGDGYHAAFETAQAAARAAIEAQRLLSTEVWNDSIGALKVRMSLHTASAAQRDGDYYGTQLNRAARLQAAAHGSQILISTATMELIQDDMPDGAFLLDLGVHRLKDLTRPEHIYQLSATGLVVKFPPIISLDTVLTNLPVMTDPFIGRERELAEVKELIFNPSCRMVTLTGPGGIGKTRLAVHTAAEIAEKYSDGVYLISLSPLSATEFIVTRIADELELEIDTHSSDLDPKTQLLDFLRQRNLLLVLDNFEHLVEGAPLLNEMLAVSPGLNLLVTSRERLNLQDEWTFEVPGLTYPQNGNLEGMENFSAVQLFIERARHADPHFGFEEGNRKAIKCICQLVEGVPLGIELAAAWSNMLSADEILREIETNIDFLASNRRDIPDKHRSLRAVFDYSWNRLTDEQRSGFMKLAVFRGGFTRQAAKDVAGIDLRQLSEFVNKSMLRRLSDGRYTMHELLRSYAGEKLDKEPAAREMVQNLHSGFYLAYLDDRVRDIKGERLKEVREEIRQELENLRKGISWIVGNWQADQARQAMIAYLEFYEVQGFHEGVDVFQSLSSLVAERLRKTDLVKPHQDPVFLSAQVIEAYFLSALGEIEKSEKICQDCVPGLDEHAMDWEITMCNFIRGINAVYRGEFEHSRRLLLHSVEMLDELDHNQDKLGQVLLWLGWVDYSVGKTDQALAQFQRSYQVLSDDGNLWGTAFALSKLGLIYDELKDFNEAMKYHQEGQKIFIEFGDRAGEAYTTSRMSMAAYGMGNYELAICYGEDGLECFQEIGHRWGMIVSLCRIAFPTMALGRLQEAENLLYEGLKRALDNKMTPLAVYALIGIACLDIEHGSEQHASDIYMLVKNHPQTPQIYLAQGEPWFNKLKSRNPESSFAESAEKMKGKQLEEVARAILAERTGERVIN